MLVLDVETTTSNKGNPFDATNRLCYIGLSTGDASHLLDIHYGESTLHDSLQTARDLIRSTDLLVGFNLKFDLHWIRRYGIDFSHCSIWDCQLVHFILTNQSKPYPSLNDVAEYYGLGSKLDVVATEYWDKGIDTPDIPRDILEEYLQGDLDLTYQVYLKQKEEIAARQDSKLETLISLTNQDLLVLEECEWNGVKYDLERSKKLGDELLERINILRGGVSAFHEGVPVNFNSPAHVSALLYGGIVKESYREAYEFRYKDGRTAIKERKAEKHHELSRLVDPLPKTELKSKDDEPKKWSTSEDVVRQLKPRGKAKELVALLLELAELQTKVERYYHGIVAKYEEKNWQGSIIHGQLNQCVARTGRLSSSDPNMQNMDGEAKQCFISRYDVPKGNGKRSRTTTEVE